MTFRSNPPTIALDNIEWEKTGREEDPSARLTAHIRIAGVDMHLEAWEVTDEGEFHDQVAKPATYREADFDSLCTMMDTYFETTTILGRDYVLIATPFGR